MQCAWFDEKNYYNFEPSQARMREIHKKPGTGFPANNTQNTQKPESQTATKQTTHSH